MANINAKSSAHPPSCPLNSQDIPPPGDSVKRGCDSSCNIAALKRDFVEGILWLFNEALANYGQSPWLIGKIGSQSVL